MNVTNITLKEPTAETAGTIRGFKDSLLAHLKICIAELFSAIMDRKLHYYLTVATRLQKLPEGRRFPTAMQRRVISVPILQVTFQTVRNVDKTKCA